MESVLTEVGAKKSSNCNDGSTIFTQVYDRSISASPLANLDKGKLKRLSKKDRKSIAKSQAKVPKSSDEDSENLLNLAALEISNGKDGSWLVESKEKSNKKYNKEDLGKKGKWEKKQCKKTKKVKSEKCLRLLLPVDEAKRLLVEQDPENMRYLQGYIHINPRFVTHSYIPIPGEELDLLIVGTNSRNKALEGDLVVASINPEEEWQLLSNGQKQKTGIVICILEELHSRKATGYLKCNNKRALLYPRDKRIPLINLMKDDAILKEFINQPDLYKDTLFLVEIISWEESLKAVGRILNVLGKAGDIETETQAILLEHNIDISPYSQEMVDELPSRDYSLTELDIKDREDWRQECVFTIDPATAVDLDDAVSCKLLENGNYEIGVHIADVTHFLKFLSPLDIEVAKRATTVYLTDNVHHMLPKNLCEICSLLPGQEKLTFSVIWELTPEAEIVKHRFAKTIIKSCCQMSYEHAQMLIENPHGNWPDGLVRVDGNFNLCQLSGAVNDLYKLSMHLRNKRFANGALSIGQPKLRVLLDKDTGLPKSYVLEQMQESNRLIEEFMLLANMTVATHLYSVQPETALLRNHIEPSARVLRYAKELLEQFGIHISTQSSASLEDSIRRYEIKMDLETEKFHSITEYRMMVIKRLCIKAMARATYKCSSTIETAEELKHYALNVPFYTHFTSPIRRYVDCMIHRLLYSSINGTTLNDWTKEMCIQIASNCNIKNYNAKLAQEESSILYFTYLVSLTGPFVALGIVAEVKERSMILILCQAGIKVQVSYADIENNATIEYGSESLVNSVIIKWTKPSVTEVFSIFTLAPVQLQKDAQHFRLNAILLPPPRNTSTTATIDCTWSIWNKN